jgi:signal transduction histidine kinase
VNRRRRVWVGFACGTALVVLAVAGISRIALRLDQEGAEARRQALIDESVRLALWRMDAALTLFLAQESQRPYFQFRAFVPADRPWADLYRPPAPEETLLASPLLTGHPEQVSLYFEVGPDCQVSSPQVAPQDQRQRALAAGASAQAMESARGLLQGIDLPTLATPSNKGSHADAAPPPQLELNKAALQLDNSIDEQWSRSAREYQVRNNQAQALTTYQNGNGSRKSAPGGAKPSDLFVQRTPSVEPCNGLDDDCDAATDGNPVKVQQRQDVKACDKAGEGCDGSTEDALGLSRCDPTIWTPSPGGEVLVPVWRRGELYLVRHVSASGNNYMQGLWLDRPAVERWLLSQVQDLLPNASLRPAKSFRGNGERRLASLPLDLIPGAVAVHDVAGGAPVWLLLAVAWAGVLLAIAAAGLLLRGALDLSERRGAFVSAVTHELRTPLTTFRMYTEMLSDGMVASREQELSYFSTLRKEADRLARLVENVLAYSRVEQGRAAEPAEPFALSVFLDRQLPVLRERAEQERMILEVTKSADDVLVKADAAAAGQILFNLIDNACKYGASANDRRIHLAIVVERRRVKLAVRDHGPGIPPDIQRRLFVPFSKSAAQAAATAPGVGLGLALCRQLARRNGGDLRFVASQEEGAQFVLTLPSA